MKFAEHLLAHITPEWRRQYIVYEDMKSMLYEAIENMPTLESAAPEEIERLTRAFDEDFLAFCEKELFKINVFYEEKLAEAKRKFDTLRKELDALSIDSNQHHHHYHHAHFLHSAQGGQRFSISRLMSGSLGGGSLSHNQQDSTTSSPHKSTLNLRQRQSMLRRPSTIKSHLLSEQQDQGLVSKLPDQVKTDYKSIKSQLSQESEAANLQQCDPSALSTDHHHQQQVVFSTHVAQAIPNQQHQYNQSNYKNYGSLTSTTAASLHHHHHNYPPKGFYRTSMDQVDGSGGFGYRSNQKQNKPHQIDRRKLNDLKLAFSEFYLSLVLLQNYQRLNFTGFRKIFKKHDKLISNEEGKRWHQAHVECAFFHTNKDVDKLIEETENIVTFKLESGDRQKAMKRLRVPPLNDVPRPWTAFRVGFSLGAFVVLLVAVLLTGIFQQTGDDWRIVFRLYRSSLFIIFFIFLVGINIYGWRAHGVNHVLIFELDPRDHLGGQDLLEIAFSFGLLWCISVLLFLWSGPIGIPPLINPMILNIIMLLYLFNPTKTLHYSARYWLICCICRVMLAPFYRVRFSDFWLADQLNSLVPVLLDIEYTSCFYFSSTDLYGNSDLIDRCVVRDPKDHILRTIVACLPAWWRFAQCVRRYFDEGHRANPHLLNAGKYATVWLVVVFSTLTEHYQAHYSGTFISPFFVCWVVSLIISSCYTYIWDVKMDWGLMDSKAPSEYKFLREELVYPVKWYYFCIIEDFVLRFGWTLNLSLTRVGAIPPDVMTLVLAPSEIFRRFLWNFYRLENEHLNNCGEFRAVRDISISGQNIDMSALNRILNIMDEPDGLTSFRTRVKAQLAAAKKKAFINEASDPSVVLVI